MATQTPIGYFKDGDKTAIYKDPDDILDYSPNWIDWMVPGDTIATLTVTPTAPMTVVSQGILPVAAIVEDLTANPPIEAVPAKLLTPAFLQGGLDGNKLPCRYRILTTGGRQKDFTIYFYIKNR